jgi:hypothetical protein
VQAVATAEFKQGRCSCRVPGFCEPQGMPIKVLNVAEKPSVAKEVSRILSNGGARSRRGRWAAAAYVMPPGAYLASKHTDWTTRHGTSSMQHNVQLSFRCFCWRGKSCCACCMRLALVPRTGPSTTPSGSSATPSTASSVTWYSHQLPATSWSWSLLRSTSAGGAAAH